MAKKSNHHSAFKILLKEIDRSPPHISGEEEKTAGSLELYTTNKKYALSLAKNYFRDGDDEWNGRALSSALSGLYIATDTYNPKLEGAVHFKSYAHSRILWEINDELGSRKQQKSSAKGKARHYRYSEGHPSPIGGGRSILSSDAKNFRAGAFDMQPDGRDSLRGYLNEALAHVSRADDLFIIQSFFGWGKPKKTLKALGEMFEVGITTIVQRRQRGLVEMREYFIDRFGGGAPTKGEATEKAREYLFGLLNL